MYPEHFYNLEVDLKSSPVELWPFVADTSRFNHDTGLPPVTPVKNATDVPPGHRRLQFYQYGFYHWVWDEEPFQWVFPYRYISKRHYKKGPLAEMSIVLNMDERPEGGTHLRYRLWVRAANFLGDIGLQVQFSLFNAPMTIKTFQKYDEMIQKGKSNYDFTGTGKFATGGHERLRSVRNTVIQKEGDKRIFDYLTQMLENADDLALQRLRPYQLAYFWKLPRRDVLEVFLRATRAGILDMRWELLCPACRGPQASLASLGEVSHNAHCNSCNIDFNVNFDRQVEVIFRPSNSIRSIPEELQFCMTGPQTGQHIVLNENILAGEKVDVTAALSNGYYSLTASGIPGERLTVAESNGPAEELIVADGSNWPLEELHISTSPQLHLINQTDTPQQFTLKRTAWRDDAATAADVTSLQVFRDLFSLEALRPGEEIQINSVTLMFTDLRDSTRMYRQIGDAPAFGRVRQHFDLLEQAIAAEGGAIVKTIGDAVMAVFREPAAALRALEVAHTAIVQLEGNPMLEMKAGIHTGPCIAVTLNERLDYFGSTVNIASRLSGISSGGEVVFSNEIKTDPEVESWLREKTANLVSFETPVKGYDEPFLLWRMKL